MISYNTQKKKFNGLSWSVAIDFPKAFGSWFYVQSTFCFYFLAIFDMMDTKFLQKHLQHVYKQRLHNSFSFDEILKSIRERLHRWN